MKQYEAIEEILSHLNDRDIALFTTGMTSREAFHIKDRETNFYIIGSMGLVSSVGLGIALNTDKKVVIFDGDGSILMDMGTMAMVASQRPSNLVHIVFDNESYQSTGGQPTISKDIDLFSVASAIGYKKVIKIDKNEDLTDFPFLLKRAGPIFIHIKVDKGDLRNIPRVSYPPVKLAERLKKVFYKE